MNEKQDSPNIVYRRWAPSSPRAVFLLVHGLGAHGGRWEALAEFFLTKGVLSYAIELEKTGNFRRYFSDVMRLRELAATQLPGKKIFLIGESMGAIISFILAAKNPSCFDGLILLSPAFANRVRLNVLDYLKIAISLLYNPANQIKLPFDSSMCTRDSRYRNRMDCDPLEYRSASARLLFELMIYQASARSAAPKITVPTLFLLPGDDKIANQAVSARVFGRLRVDDKALVKFPGMYHSLSVEMGRQAVFEEILRWIERRI
ncbi:MAG: lysophospholipase [Candidatus Omnitrophica bacterium]|nr:lysophospholipase [Candidatus Omnitrophota bacterium]MCM8791492.1 lysophospholipase [Candidatus Omnitrophota bacterium]